ncbi:MAG: hypothetical protein ISS47_07445, partial [Candidatus Omnitrophica bacterium]|nr:hypothetical protein [Candidatus Omnitrophota bacterium]
MKRIKQILINLLTSLIIISILLVTLEFLYRKYRMFKYCILVKDIEDPLLQIVKDRREYILKPNSEFTLKNGIVYKINSKGLRD